MTTSLGEWIWYELMTPDAAASAAFYAPLLGWEVREDPEYREIKAPDGEFVGGMLQLTPEMTAGGARPAWVGYLCVEDVDTAIAALTKAGGKVYMPARDMPEVGRFAMVADCCGAPFYIMTPTPPPGGGESTTFSAAKNPGHCGWNELMAGNAANAEAFYTKLFGWTLPEPMDMGEMGKYQFVAYDGVTHGAIMQKPQQVPVATWNHYFWVPGIEAAAKQVAANGGTVINGPMAVPGDDWIIQAIDPQGAAFALVGGK
jgi:uncharacterized protein